MAPASPEHSHRGAWTFSVVERSAGVFEATAVNAAGPRFVLVGNDPAELLGQLERDLTD